MIEKDIKEKTIQWIKLEKEVMDIIIEKTGNKEITHAEWAQFFIKSVKEYGNENMLKQLKVYVDYLKSIKEILNITNDNIDEMFTNLEL